MGFVDLKLQPTLEPAPGVKLRAPHGKNLMLSYVEIEAGSEVPLHEHSHEQAGIVLSGKMLLQIGDEERELVQGDMYIIPGGVAHRAVAVDGPVVAMDVFSPIREDYLQPSS